MEMDAVTTTKKIRGAKAEQKKRLDDNLAKAKLNAAKELHFVPMPLMLTILVCSGALSIMAYRDMFGTGKVIFGAEDAAMLHFTGSTRWFNDSNGWKSTAGGFSAVEKVTTDKNDMGGFFVRKMAGSAALAFHLTKLIPILFQKSNVHWGHGHFKPMLLTSCLGDLAVAAFYISYLEDFKIAGAERMGFGVSFALIFEALVILGFVITASLFASEPSLNSKTLPAGKSPKSMVSKIVTRTVCTVSGVITIICSRDFFFPGKELPFPPYDDIYLEWTGAFIHSPPADTIEEIQYGLEAPLRVGDKFVSRVMALYLLIFCLQKFACAFLIRVGKDNSGEVKCKMFWQAQTLGNALILFTIRVFSPAALSASLDFRWHTMSLGYETFIVGLYAFC